MSAAITTTRLHQSEIPGAPPSAVVRNYSLAAIAEMEVDVRATLPTESPSAVGVSIELALAGPRIQTLALATRDNVFCLSVPQPPSPSQRKTLQKLFSFIPYLTGFEFPYTIVLLAYLLGSNVAGYDLSTLSTNSKRQDITTPGNFLYSKSVSAMARRINNRWDGGIPRSGARSAGAPRPNYALRAWFTAM
jgi:hypothetical protein